MEGHYEMWEQQLLTIRISLLLLFSVKCASFLLIAIKFNCINCNLYYPYLHCIH
jgi:hypothetical protein